MSETTRGRELQKPVNIPYSEGQDHFLLVDFPLLTDGVVAFLHGGSPCKSFATRSFQNRAEPTLNFQLQPGHPPGA